MLMKHLWRHRATHHHCQPPGPVEAPMEGGHGVHRQGIQAGECAQDGPAVAVGATGPLQQFLIGHLVGLIQGLLQFLLHDQPFQGKGLVLEAGEQDKFR